MKSLFLNAATIFSESKKHLQKPIMKLTHFLVTFSTIETDFA